MDVAVVVAALILNPIARRKRAAQASEPSQMAEAPAILTSGIEGSNHPGEYVTGWGYRPAMGRNSTGVRGSRQDLVARLSLTGIPQSQTV